MHDRLGAYERCATIDHVRDVRYALRLLRKSPIFSLYVMAPLALGIGLNGAIFLLLDALVLRPLPVKHPETLVRIAQDIQNIGIRSYYSYDALAALQKNSTTLSDIIGYSDLNTAVRDASGASRVRVQLVSGNYFTALGVQPLYGRVITDTDAGQPAAVLSYPYWLREFHGDPAAIGRTLRLADHTFTIIGVTPRAFNGLEVETTPDLRIPLTAADLVAARSEHDVYRQFSYSLAGRLRSGVTLEQARVETERINVADTDLAARQQMRDERIVLEPAANGISLLRPKYASSLVLLLGGVALLLAMICANAGGLLLARASARQEEAAVRMALGASAGRLIRQWLAESLVLTVAGGAIGIALAFAATPLLLRAMPVVRDAAATVLTFSLDIRPDWRLAAFVLALCVFCALFAGLPAALQARRANLHTALRSSRATLRQPLRWMLVALQIGLCTFLVAGAWFLISTFRHLRAMDPGFDRDHVVAFSVDPDMAHYTHEQELQLVDRLTASVRELPGVRSAGIGVLGLMHGTGMKTTVAPSGEKVPRSDFMNTSLNFVSPEYFDTLGIPLLAGRNLGPGDRTGQPERVVVNRAFVRRFFPQRDPFGQTFGIGADKIVTPAYEIVGVVGDARYRSLRETIPPTFYHLWPRGRQGVDPFILHVRSANRPESVIESVRKTLNAIDPRLPFYEVRTMSQEVDATLWAERLLAWLSGVFAIAAAVLAAMGVYVTLAYAIAQSQREIGIRVALGARAGDVLRLFSARPMRFAGMGVLAGIAGFYAAAPVFRSVLYDVSPVDPVTLGTSMAGVLLIALAATLVAVGAALRVDPAVVLRDE